MQDAARLANIALLFKPDKSFRDARAAQSQGGREIVVGNRKDAAVRRIARQTNPTGQPLFSAVSNTTQSNLRIVQGERLDISREVLADPRTFAHEAIQIANW